MENVTQYVVLGVFVFAFLAIIFEEHIGLAKYKTSMFLGLTIWVMLLIQGSLKGEKFFKVVEHSFNEYMLEISMLWLFLISAMTFVAYLDKRGWIEKCVMKLLPEELSEKKFLLIMGAFTFLFSGIADNLTATLVALSIVLIVMKKTEGETIIKFGVFIVLCANAGGLPLITGDVTTLMIFVAKKVSMVELLKLYLPAVVICIIMYMYLIRGMNEVIRINKEAEKINSLDTKIAIIFILTIISILAGHVMFHLPPVLTFLTGLSVMFLTIAKEKKKQKQEIKILEFFHHIEFDALFFFLGVLLLVGALKEVEVLGKLSILYEIINPIFATFLIGILSAIIDNIPITAAMLKADLPLDEKGWFLMTYAVGIGGSLLVIGSAAGVVSMSKVKSMTFVAYMKYTPMLFVVYVIGMFITYLIAGLYSQC